MPNVIDDVRNRRIINEMLGETQVGGLDYINFKSNTKNLKGALACVEKTFDIIKTEHIDVNTVGAEEELTKQLRDAGFLRFMSNSVPQIIGMYNDYQQRLLDD